MEQDLHPLGDLGGCVVVDVVAPLSARTGTKGQRSGGRSLRRRRGRRGVDSRAVCDSDRVLTRAEGRVLGALIEKQLTTPDIYPLTLKALTGACNQTSNRDPVMTIEPLDVETTVLVLKTKGLARVVHPGSGERSTRYRQVAEEVFGLDESERALLCVLLLRGAQTAGRAADPHRAPPPVLVARGRRAGPRRAGRPGRATSEPGRAARRARKNPAGPSSSKTIRTSPTARRPGRRRSGRRRQPAHELTASPTSRQESSDWRPRSQGSGRPSATPTPDPGPHTAPNRYRFGGPGHVPGTKPCADRSFSCLERPGRPSCRRSPGRLGQRLHLLEREGAPRPGPQAAVGQRPDPSPARAAAPGDRPLRTSGAPGGCGPRGS